jgi:hypothetical protein
MCLYRINLLCTHPRFVRRMGIACPRSCKKKGADEKEKRKCTKCAGRKRGSLARRAGGAKAFKPKPKPSFIVAVKQQKQRDRQQAAAAKAALAPPVVQQSGHTNAQTMPHVRVVRRDG